MFPKEKEIFVVDGGSSDGTVDIVKKLCNKIPELKLIHNKKKYVSHGFNIAYKLSKGSYISLIGAHTKYPKDYFKIALSILESNQSDVVGGYIDHVGDDMIGDSIACCMSSRFGVGDSQFRVSKERKFVDTVPFAVYRRDVINKTGLLNICIYLVSLFIIVLYFVGIFLIKSPFPSHIP